MTSVFAGDTKISEISLRLGIRVDLTRRSREERDAHVYYNLLSLSVGPCVRARWYQLDDASKQKISRVSEARFRPRNREGNTCVATPSVTNAISECENSIKFHITRFFLTFPKQIFCLNVVHVHTLIPY